MLQHKAGSASQKGYGCHFRGLQSPHFGETTLWLRPPAGFNGRNLSPQNRKVKANPGAFPNRRVLRHEIPLQIPATIWIATPNRSSARRSTLTMTPATALWIGLPG